MSAAVAAACGCLSGPGRTVTDPARHAAWHTEVVEQAGIETGPVDLDALRAARAGQGAMQALAAETVLDTRARTSGKRASGKLREACRDD